MFHRFPWPSQLTFIVVVVHSPSHVQLFGAPRTATRQASMSLTISRNLSTCPISCPLHQWCHPANSVNDDPFSFCPQSFPASGTFPMCQLFTSSYQHTGASASASVLPMNIQSWFPLRLTGWSPCTPRDSKESSPAPQSESINSSALSLLNGSTLNICTELLEKP